MKNVSSICKIIFFFKIILIVILFVSETGVVFSQQDTIKLFPIQDNTLYEDTTGQTSNGRGEFMFTGKNSSGKIRRGVIKYMFVELLPPCVKILNVSLKMHLSGGSVANQTIELRKMTENWGEGSSNAPGLEENGTQALPFDATWLHQFYSTDLWQTAGGSFSGIVSGSTVVGSPGFYTWVSTPQMVNDVQSWINNASNNFGWLLKGDEINNSSAKRFHTSEEDTSGFAPELNVIFQYPKFNLYLKSLIEGFWNGTIMVGDTIKVKLRNSTAPYAIVDSASSFCRQFGGIFCFHNAAGGNYYIQVNHRNSIETWSKLPVLFDLGDFVSYDFTDSVTKAYGDNMILKSSRYCFYSGDVNQDGVIDISDNELIDNDAFNFASGYLNTDVNGDNTVDIADATIADNNSFNFVSIVRP